jgi:hypothetical protein
MAQHTPHVMGMHVTSTASFIMDRDGNVVNASGLQPGDIEYRER